MAVSASDIDVHVGQRIRARREALGISQGDLGRYLGLTFSQIQKYEKGSNRIGSGRLYLTARALGVHVQYFFEGLEDESSSWHPIDRIGKRSPTLADVDAALCGIGDAATRHSILALVSTLMQAPARASEAKLQVGSERR
jgi:transcriptional regulator with XRE-family HTH domain